MKALVLSAVLLGACLTYACNVSYITDGVRGNNKLKTETRSLGSFSRIVVEGAMNLHVNAADSIQKVSVQADDNILPLIKMEIHDSTLRIYTDKSYSCTNGVEVTIATRNISGIAIQGSADAKVSAIHSPGFEMHIDGSGDAVLDGNTGNLYVEVNGSGDVNARALHAASADIEINGSGDVAANVEKSLKIEINGSGDVEYSGNPATVKQNVNGSGSVTKK